MPMCMANPTIKFLPSDEYYYEEGCLSFPEIKGDVARPERIIVDYNDLDGVSHTLLNATVYFLGVYSTK